MSSLAVAGMSEDECAQLLALLQRVRTNLERAEPESAPRQTAAPPPTVNNNRLRDRAAGGHLTPR